MLSETHVAVIPKSRIVADVESIEEELCLMMNAAPGYVAFISGASRTADIERVLTIGVHGPQELHVLILEED
jgi:L-lactate dehydrogenase complex protein LldG